MKRKQVFKAGIALAVALAFLMPGAVAVLNNEKAMNNELNNVINTESLDFTHTVFAEDATATGCSNCHYAREALDAVYSSGDYPFFYVCLVDDVNTHAATRINDFNLYGFPTVFFDYGYKTVVGGWTGAEADYRTAITQCGARSVADIDVSLNVAWLGDAAMNISVGVTNNEAAPYAGHLHVYVTEIESSLNWKDTTGHPYTFPFLDYAFNEPITMASGETWENSITWDGHNYNSGMGQDFGTIQYGNIAVIAAVFNNTWHQGYAYPPSGNPFDAYYVDETAAATPTGMPPNKPSMPSGPSTGEIGIEYMYISSTTDPDEDDIFYLFDWDDGTNSGWLGPYNSGGTAVASHAWTDEGSYEVKVKAKDVHSAESDWSDPLTVYIGAGPIIKIGDISGGIFKISAVVKNNGSVDATWVNWSIILDGGLILSGKETRGRILNLPAGEEKTVSSGLILGFGKTVVTVTAEIPGVSSDTEEQEAFVLLFFVKM